MHENIFFNVRMAPLFSHKYNVYLSYGLRNFLYIFTTIWHPSRMEISVQKSPAEA